VNEEWVFKPCFNFEVGHPVAVRDADWHPMEGVGGYVSKRGQRSTKNKKGESVFDTNSYLVDGNDGKTYYFLEKDLI
jgi:hypothetical protein